MKLQLSRLMPFKIIVKLKLEMIRPLQFQERGDTLIRRLMNKQTNSVDGFTIDELTNSLTNK